MKQKIATLFLLLAIMKFSFAQISLTATVGTTSASYTTLKGAFDAINAGTHKGAIAISVTANTTEGTASIVLNASGSGSASYTSISIKPSGGSARTITAATVAGSPMIDINGADNVTIDGLNTGGNALTISNTTASATAGTSTIRFQADATNNTITNCSVLGSSTVSLGGGNGGNIWFGSGTTTGNDGNTVSNCNIGPAGTNLPAKCIFFAGSSNTDPGSANSGITINNNNIFDYFLATNASGGIDLNSGTTNITISNNRFYQTATRTQTTGVAHRPISINNASGNNYQITVNTIGYASSGGTGKYTFSGPSSSALFTPIYVNTGTTGTSIQGNTIAGIAVTGAISGSSTSVAFACIYIAGGLVNIGDITGNTIGNMTDTSSITYTSSSSSASDVVGIFRTGTNNWTTNNNTIGGIKLSSTGTGAVNFYGLRSFSGSTNTWVCNNNTIGGSISNSINSTSTATGTIVGGISDGGTSGPIGSFRNNTIRNMTVAGGTGTNFSSSMMGMVMSNVSTDTLIGNTIYNLSNTNTSAATVVTGIQFTSSATNNLVEKNFIYNLSSATNNATAELNGIKASQGTTVYKNNMIVVGLSNSNAIGTGVTGGINGINETVGTNKFYHNSVYVGGTSTSGVGSSFAFNSTVVTNIRDFRNNIFENERSNNGATGKHYAVRVGGTAANPAGLTINYNLYYGAGSGFVFGYFNSADVTSLTNWKTAVGQDAASLQGNPQFEAPTAGTPDLHLSATIASSADANGVDVSVSDDFDGDVRSTLSPVDIGADAICFTTKSTTTQNQCGGNYTWNGVTYTTSGTYTKSFTNSKGCDSIATLNLIIRTCETTSLNFDGVNDYVTVPYNATLNPAQFSIQCWVKMTNSGNYAAVLSNRDGSNGSSLKGYTIYKTPLNQWAFWLGKGTNSWSTITTTTTNVSNTWTQLTATYDGTTMRLYVNGVLSASTASAYTVNTVYPLLIGTGANELGTGGYQFYSQMTVDDIRIWNKALTQTEITNNMNCQINGAQSGLVANYQFDEGSYNVNNNTVISLTDASGNNFNGTLTNFGLTGTSSNWVPHTIATISDCNYVFGGTTYTTSGTYTKTLTNSKGCDSAVALIFTVTPLSSTSTVKSCVSYIWAGTTYTSSGVFTKTFVNARGCDSVAILNLTINQPTTSSTTVSNCTSYTWNGVTYTSSGVYTKNFTNAKGCDSVATLNLTIYPTASVTNVSVPYSSNITPYVWNGMSFTQTTTKVLHYTNVAGCDSTATLNFQVVGGPTYSLDFSYSQSNYVTLPNGSINTRITAGKLTVSAWINMRSYQYNGTIMANWGDFGGAFWFKLNGSSGELSLLVNQSQSGVISVVSPNKLSLYEWHNVAFSADGQWITLYEDGVEVAKAPYDGTLKTTSSAAQIGALPTNNGTSSLGGYWDGQISELKLWNKAMKSCQIASNLNCYLAGSDFSLIAYYKFNQGIAGASNTTQTSLIDSSGNSINGTLRNFLLTSTISNWGNNKPLNSFNYCTQSNVPTSSVNINICSSQLPYKFLGQIINAAGTYNFRVPNYNGCADSIVVLNLSTTITENKVKLITNSDFNSSTYSISYGGYTYVHTANYSIDKYLANKDSIMVCGGSTLLFEFSGTSQIVKKVIIDGVNINIGNNATAYTLIMDNRDHTVEVIWGAPCASSSSSTTNLSICPNQFPYTWNGLTFNTVGSKTASLTTVVDFCDSFATLNLSLQANYIITATASVNGSINSLGSDTICSGNNKQYLFTANAGYAISDVIVDGVSMGAISSYTFTNIVSNHTISVSFTLGCVANLSITNLSICSNQLPYSWNGLTFTSTGSQTAHLTNVCGSDSAATLNLTVNATTSSTSNVAICLNQLPYTWNGQTLTTAGTVTVHLNNTKGCDSTATLNLTIKNGSSSVTNITVNSLPFTWNGNAYTSSGTYSVIFVNSAGCDSIATLNLSALLNTDTTIRNVNICSNKLPFRFVFYDYNGANYRDTLAYSSGSYSKHVIGSNGQDSFVVFNLNVTSPFSMHIDTFICNYSLPFIYKGNLINSFGSSTVTLRGGVFGCDTVVNVNLYHREPSQAVINQTVTSYPFYWNGIKFDKSGIYTINLINKAGCDSIVTLNLMLPNELAGVSVKYIFPTNQISMLDTTICYSTPVKFVATPATNVTSNNQYVIHKWYKNNINVKTITVMASDTSFYIDSTLRNADTIQCKIFRTPSSISLFMIDTAFSSNNKIMWNVINPKSTLFITLLKRDRSGISFTADFSKTSLVNVQGFCNNDSWSYVETRQPKWSSTIADSGVLSKSISPVPFSNSTDYVNFAPTGKTGLGLVKIAYPIGNNSDYCQTGYAYLAIPSNFSNPIPPITIISDTNNTLCIGGKVNLYNSDTTGLGVWRSTTAGLDHLGNGIFKLNYYSSYYSMISSKNENYVPTAEYGYTIPILPGYSQVCYKSQSVSFPIQSINPVLLATPTIGTSNKLCVGSSMKLTNATTIPAGSSIIWGNTEGRATVDTAGNVVGTSQGTANIRYIIKKYNGCESYTDYGLNIIALPAVPSIAYAPNTPSPQTTSVAGVIGLCKNKTFTLVGSPANGVWNKTGVITLNPTVTPSTTTVVNTGNLAGAASIVYTVSDVNGCSNSRTFNANVVACAAKEINNQLAASKEQLVIYPNPARSIINLNVKTLVGAGSIVVTDLYGKQLKQQTLSMGTNTIDVSHFANGMYLISIITERGKQTQKVIVE